MGCSLWVSGLVLLVLVVSPTGYSLECVDALTPLIPCLGFLTGSGPDVLDPTGPCCQGAQQLDNIAANSQQDRQSICECFKEAANSYPVDFVRANQVPSFCSLKVNVTISPSVDCTIL